MKKQQLHKTSGTGYCLIEIDKQLNYEFIIACFGSRLVDKHAAIGYTQGYIHAMSLYKRGAHDIKHTVDSSKDGWRWWNDTTEWMVVDKNGKMAN